MTSLKLLAVGALAFATVLSGCSTHAVRCDGKLSPINSPAPAGNPKQPQDAEARP